MHMDGHRFPVLSASSVPGPCKDSVIVNLASVAVDLVADDPGEWMLHRLNACQPYAGKMT